MLNAYWLDYSIGSDTLYSGIIHSRWLLASRPGRREKAFLYGLVSRLGGYMIGALHLN